MSSKRKKGCPLAIEVDKVSARGSKRPDILIVGEAPGPQDNDQGRAFVGPPGKLLDAIIKSAKIDEKTVRFTNCCRYFPQDDDGGIRKPFVEEIEACLPALWKEIAKVKPKVIVPVGGTAITIFTGVKTVSRVRGQKRAFEFQNGKGKIEIPLVATYHPAFVLRGNTDARELMLQDLMLARDIALGKKTAMEKFKPRFKVLKTHKAIKSFVDDMIKKKKSKKLKLCGGAVAVDIESDHELDPFDPMTTLVSIQVAWTKRDAVFIPILHNESPFSTAEDMRKIATQLQRLFEKVPVVGQNFKFDWKWLYAKLGIEIPADNVALDTMLAHNMLNGGSLPNNLGYMSARYLGLTGFKEKLTAVLNSLEPENRSMRWVPIKDLTYYGCMDTVTTLALADRFYKQLKKEGMWESYKLLVKDGPWDMMVWMEVNGVRIDEATANHLMKIYPERTKEWVGLVEGSSFFPEWRKKHRKPNPKRWQRVTKKFLAELDADGTTLKKHAKKKKWKLRKQKWRADDWWYYADPKAPRYVEKKFSMSSPADLKSLLYDVMQCPNIYEESSTQWMEWGPTEKYTLQNLGDWAYGRSKAPCEVCAMRGKKKQKKKCKDCRKMQKYDEHFKIIKAILDYRKVHKIYSSYIKKIPAYISHDGVVENPHPYASIAPTSPPWTVHTTFKMHGAKTGRLSSVDPPLQTIPWKGDVKDMFISRWPRGLLIHADYSQMELRVLAMLAEDDTFAKVMRQEGEFASYGGDIHRFVASRVFKIPPEEVKDYQRRQAKTVSFGIPYGRGNRTTAFDSDMTVEEVEALVKDYFKIFPKTKIFIDRVRKEGRNAGHVMSPTGRKLPMPGANDPDPEIRTHAERCAVNYPVQGGASDLGLIGNANVWRELRRKEFESYPFAMVHDSFEYDVKPPELFRLLDITLAELQTNIPKQLPWVTIPLKVDYEIGACWGRSMELCSWDTKKNVLVVEGNSDFWPEVKEKLAWYYNVKELNVEDKGFVESIASLSGQIAKGELMVIGDYTKIKVTVKLKLKRRFNGKTRRDS